MKLINHVPNFNNVNLGYDYTAGVDDGSTLTRSSAGTWALKTKGVTPLSLEDLQADLDKFLLANGRLATENDVKVDNASQTVIEPLKQLATVPVKS